MSTFNTKLHQPVERVARPLRGLEKVCKLYGRMKCGDVMMAWDYANECAIPEKELRADKARWAASEKAKWSNAGTELRLPDRAATTTPKI